MSQETLLELMIAAYYSFNSELVTRADFFSYYFSVIMIMTVVGSLISAYVWVLLQDINQPEIVLESVGYAIQNLRTHDRWQLGFNLVQGIRKYLFLWIIVHAHCSITQILELTFLTQLIIYYQFKFKPLAGRLLNNLHSFNEIMILFCGICMIFFTDIS